MKPPAQTSFFKKNLFSGKKISHLDRLLFTKHLATMIKAGIPIAEALASLADSAKSVRLKKIIKNLLQNVQNGQSLADSLKKHPKAFDNFYISMIQVGEEAGTLEQNLEFLSLQLKKDYTLHQKIKGALLYPELVFLSTIIMGGFISLFVLPKLVSFFDSFNVNLPTTTKILLWFANLMKNHGLSIISGLVLLVFAATFILNLSKVKPWWHKVMLKLPLFGNLIASGQLARFSRNLGTLIKSGVPITRSLDITADTLSNLKFKNDLKQISQILSKGKNIGEALEDKAFNEFPGIVSKMISVGEKTGKLEDTLLYLSAFYEDEIDNVSKNLTTTLEPILLLTIGLIVGFVALAIISPIYELTGSIRK